MLTSNYSRIKIVDISIRIKIDPIFDFQNNVHIRVEKKKINNYTPEANNVESFAVASLTLLKTRGKS